MAQDQLQVLRREGLLRQQDHRTQEPQRQGRGRPGGSPDRRVPFDPQLPPESLHARPVLRVLPRPSHQAAAGQAAGRPLPQQKDGGSQQPDGPQPLRRGACGSLFRRRGLGPHRRRGRRRSGRCGLRRCLGQHDGGILRHGQSHSGPQQFQRHPDGQQQPHRQQQPQHRTALRPIPPLDETGEKQQGQQHHRTAQGQQSKPLKQGSDHRASPLSSSSRAWSWAISCWSTGPSS